VFEWVTDAIIGFVDAYGYVAFFVFIVLETAFIIHFAPSEVVIPLAAARMVNTPAEFALFVVLGTVGGVIGSLIAYQLFGVNGEVVLRKYGHVFRIPESEIDRSQEWFHRYGEGLMFWGRMIPVLRVPISIPAGFARMDTKKFSLYSAGGWFCYHVILVWLVYDGGEGEAPAEVALAFGAQAAESNPWLAALLGIAALGACVWYVADRREWRLRPPA